MNAVDENKVVKTKMKTRLTIDAQIMSLEEMTSS